MAIKIRSLYKLFPKFIETRLAAVMNNLISPNQSTTLKNGLLVDMLVDLAKKKFLPHFKGRL